ncbi:ferredoxin--NADP(+) reductase [Erwinia tracheiphila]|uniref:Flavodoxin/ferredoxin--NADP reductase n=1 Tax=Erwinia tracheiphila TaxID=65700 RepID=A0A345CYJ3_9GAMM|nr:ferredoxin--NADP(+) reductase [Erwinia tracheiphila]AXF78510.1 ferredoxin--NADP(+) reductase [Erwinia tracheiphila]UIA82764.1 ferredoxin--NADP(+) reductase [Erwinia tracheiphila]UIA91347.1 ferredoxin--NADP(+) reductase [Erwinia tracheiphila]
MAEWINASIKEVKNWTDSLFSLIVTAPIDPFIAGQFAKLSLEIEGKRVQRAYSFVNAPSDAYLEFYIVNVPQGKLSPFLHQLQPGQQVSITKASTGFFVLDEIPPCKTLWMLATGTAIGPYLSILQEGKGLERFENIVLIHASRYAQDLSYLPLMQQLQQRYNGQLRIQTVVSREEATGSLTGRVPALIASGELEAAVGLPIEAAQSHIMLCGNPQMVRDTQQLLKDTHQMRKHLKRKPGHMTSEHYW